MGKYIPKIITQEDYEYLRDSIRDVATRNYGLYYQTAFDLARYAGLRIGEVVTIRVSNIDLSQGLITLPTQKNGRVYEKVALPERLIGQLRIHTSRYGEMIESRGGWLFPSINRRKGHLNTQALKLFCERLREYCKLDQVYGLTKDGRKKHIFSFHTLRHLFGTTVFERSEDIRKTQLLMRHENIQSTLIYENTGIEFKKKIINQVF